MYDNNDDTVHHRHLVFAPVEILQAEFKIRRHTSQPSAAPPLQNMITYPRPTQTRRN